ncbi:hypothetical protein OH76DRAFT_1490362 [Lentinus brumalis]|uniref:Uncharacterized protein n=1 Tax=Lentinus brumalis TaxID=2498619 RepID=A0A371CJ93_9APHY|nr:hypothetical protein OH76DRAFT_1490362 [Polyporus brumalis]
MLSGDDVDELDDNSGSSSSSVTEEDELAMDSDDHATPGSLCRAAIDSLTHQTKQQWVAGVPLQLRLKHAKQKEKAKQQKAKKGKAKPNKTPQSKRKAKAKDGEEKENSKTAKGHRKGKSTKVIAEQRAKTDKHIAKLHTLDSSDEDLDSKSEARPRKRTRTASEKPKPQRTYIAYIVINTPSLPVTKSRTTRFSKAATAIPQSNVSPISFYQRTTHPSFLSLVADKLNCDVKDLRMDDAQWQCMKPANSPRLTLNDTASYDAMLSMLANARKDQLVIRVLISEPKARRKIMVAVQSEHEYNDILPDGSSSLSIQEQMGLTVSNKKFARCLERLADRYQDNNMPKLFPGKNLGKAKEVSGVDLINAPHTMHFTVSNAMHPPRGGASTAAGAGATDTTFTSILPALGQFLRSFQPSSSAVPSPVPMPANQPVVSSSRSTDALDAFCLSYNIPVEDHDRLVMLLAAVRLRAITMAYVELCEV